VHQVVKLPYHGEKICSTLSRQLGWSSFVENLLIDDQLKRVFEWKAVAAANWRHLRIGRQSQAPMAATALGKTARCGYLDAMGFTPGLQSAPRTASQSASQWFTRKFTNNKARKVYKNDMTQR
jgi:hypothetical protein